MRVRAAAVFGGIVAVLIGGAVSLWFFSNPGGLSRYQATSALVAFATQALALSAVTGFAAMATLEILKRLLHLRAWFFLGQVRGLELMLGRPGRGESVPSRRDSVRRFDIPLEQLMAQLGYAVDQALDERFSADRAPAPELADLPRLSSIRSRRLEGQSQLLTAVLGEDSMMLAEFERSQSGEYDLTRLRLEAQAGLDNLQAELGNRWRWRLRLSSCAFAALFALAVLIYVPVPPGAKLAAFIGSFLLGGFLAGFFRDLTALIERYRRL